MKQLIRGSTCKSGHARGRLSRTGALMAALAICACTAVRLDAVVIDDFENGVKWAQGGGGTNYFVWGLTNGQMAPWFQNAGEEWIVANGVLRVFISSPPQYGGIALCPLGTTNVEAVLRDFYASVDTFDWMTSGTNWSALALVGRGEAKSPSFGSGYFGGIGLNYDGIPGRITPWIHNGSTETHGVPFSMETFPPPYRVDFSGVGTKMTLRVHSLTTGQILREMSFTRSTYPTGIVGLWFNGRHEAGDYYTNTVDNFVLIGTKP